MDGEKEGEMSGRHILYNLQIQPLQFPQQNRMNTPNIFIDSASDSDSSMMSTMGNFDRNEVPGCSQFPMHPSCPVNHQQGCMLWSPKPCNLNMEQLGCSSLTQLPRNEDQMISSDEADGECESECHKYQEVYINH